MSPRPANTSERGKGLCPLSEHWQMSDPRAAGLTWILCYCDQAFVPETAEAALLLPTAPLGSRSCKHCSFSSSQHLPTCRGS